MIKDGPTRKHPLPQRQPQVHRFVFSRRRCEDYADRVFSRIEMLHHIYVLRGRYLVSMPGNCLGIIRYE